MLLDSAKSSADCNYELKIEIIHKGLALMLKVEEISMLGISLRFIHVLSLV